MSEVQVEPDVRYGEADGQQLFVDIYRLPDAQAPRPAVILIHSVLHRGLAYPSRKEMGAEAAQLAAAGFVAVTLGYRLFAFETGVVNPWPVQLDDAQRAVRWVRANAATYAVDPERIGAYGHSNGGHIAALLGLRETRDNSDAALAAYSSRVRCVVSLAGDMDLTIPYTTAPQQAAIETYLGGSGEAVPEVYRDASPVHWVNGDSAPFLLQHGAKDEQVPVEHAHVMLQALQAASVEVATVFYPRYRNEGVRNWPLTGWASLAFLARHLDLGQ
jgi:acetyl esterase/lipase